MRRVVQAAVLALACALAAALAACGPAGGGCDGPPDAPGACTRVLFVGNSYTFANDLPGTFAALARSADRPVEVAMIAVGGATLADHASSRETLGRLASGDWDVVVLQEQSQVPAASDARSRGMSPAVRTLAAATRDGGGRPLLFETWAHRGGWPERGLAGYEAMQTAIDDGYLAVARESGASVAPVGSAWRAALATARDIALWDPDGSHPSPAGTYLAACVFYASIFGQSPEGLAEHGGLGGDEAAVLQAIAARAVLGPRA